MICNGCMGRGVWLQCGRGGWVADGMKGVADNGTVLDGSDETPDSCCRDIVTGGNCETIGGGDTEQGLVGEMVEEDVGTLLDLYNSQRFPSPDLLMSSYTINTAMACSLHY